MVTAAAAKSLQSCPTLCDPRDGSPPGSLVPGILQARPLEWVAISFSNAWKWKVKVKSLSRVWLFVTPWTAAHQAPPSMGFPGKSTGVGCHCLLQWISFRTFPLKDVFDSVPVRGRQRWTGLREERTGEVPKLAEDLAERQVSAVETSQQAAGLRGGCFSPVFLLAVR